MVNDPSSADAPTGCFEWARLRDGVVWGFARGECRADVAAARAASGCPVAADDGVELYVVTLLALDVPPLSCFESAEPTAPMTTTAATTSSAIVLGDRPFLGDAVRATA